MTMPNCKECRYRYWLAKAYGVHVWGIDCDKCGTKFCDIMNDPKFLERTKKEDYDVR